MLVASGLLLPVLLTLFLQAPPAAPARGPLTEAEVVFLLQSGVTPARVRALVDRHGVELELSERILALMREAGADAPLLEAVQRRAASPRPAEPTAMPAVPRPSAATPAPPPSEIRVDPTPGPVSPFEPELVVVPGGPSGEMHFGRFEVTNRQYLQFCSRTSRRRPQAPFWGLNDRYPVVNVTWQDAAAFCRWLAKETGRPYRLPAAAEWEHAARGGAVVPRIYPWGDQDPLGRSCFGTGLLCPVGTYKPNPYGLHDMAGSVAEWCSDGKGDSRIVKGGSWATPVVSPETLSIARRDELETGKTRNEVGFRVVRGR